MQNPRPELRQSSFISEKPGILFEKLTSSNYFNIFWWNFAHVSYLTMPTKECSGFSLFCLDIVK